MNDKIRVALIYGSARKGRFCDKVAGWAAEQIANHGGFSLDVIDPAVESLQGRTDEESATGAPTLWQRVA